MPTTILSSIRNKMESPTVPDFWMDSMNALQGSGELIAKASLGSSSSLLSRSDSIKGFGGEQKSRRLSWLVGRPSSCRLDPEKQVSKKQTHGRRNSGGMDLMGARRNSFIDLLVQKSSLGSSSIENEGPNTIILDKDNNSRLQDVSDTDDVTSIETTFSATEKVSKDEDKESKRPKSGKRGSALLRKASWANLRRSYSHDNIATFAPTVTSRSRETFPRLFQNVQLPRAEVSTRCLVKPPSQHHILRQTAGTEPFDISGLHSRAAVIMIQDLWTDDPQQVALGLRELQALCSQEATVEALKLVGFGTVLGSLRRWHGHAEVQREGVRFLCFDDSSAVIDEDLMMNAVLCGALEAVCSAMRNFPKDQALHELGTRAIYAMVSMSNPLPAQRFLSDPDNVSRLHQSVATFKTSKSVSKHASLAFCSMSRFRHVRDELHCNLVAARNKPVAPGA